MTLYPIGYDDEYVGLDELFARVESEAGGPMHPTYRYWLRAWIEGQGGLIGIGDGWRPDGSDTSDASAANKSFHQTQRFASGRETWCAVDVVAANPGGDHRTVKWSEVPEQGSSEAARWNVHANVNGEPWHIQPTNIDGFDRWDDAGRPDPLPLPPTNPPTPGDDDMAGFQLVLCDVRAPYPSYLAGHGFKTWIDDGDAFAQIQMRLDESDNGTKPSPWDGIVYRRLDHGDDDLLASYGPIVGNIPPKRDKYGRAT